MADKSIADLLRESVANATDPEPKEIELPIFDPPLVMSLVKIKDAKEREAAMEGLDQIRDESDRGLQALARLLLLACKSVTVEINGESHQMPNLGSELYTYIYPDNPTPPSDVEAVFGLYTNAKGECDTVALVDAASEYVDWTKTAHREAHEVVLGESQPV